MEITVSVLLISVVAFLFVTSPCIHWCYPLRVSRQVSENLRFLPQHPLCRNKKECTLLTLITNAVLHGFSTPANDFYLCSVLIKHMCKVMKYSLYKADAEEENEDSPKLDSDIRT